MQTLKSVGLFLVMMQRRRRALTPARLCICLATTAACLAEPTSSAGTHSSGQHCTHSASPQPWSTSLLPDRASTLCDLVLKCHAVLQLLTWQPQQPALQKPSATQRCWSAGHLTLRAFEFRDLESTPHCEDGPKAPISVRPRPTWSYRKGSSGHCLYWYFGRGFWRCCEHVCLPWLHCSSSCMKSHNWTSASAHLEMQERGFWAQHLLVLWQGLLAPPQTCLSAMAALHQRCVWTLTELDCCAGHAARRSAARGPAQGLVPPVRGLAR